MPATAKKKKKLTKNHAVVAKHHLQQIAFNAVTDKAKVRDELLEGRPHWVVPMVMLQEGVFAGSQGPLYYPEEELEDSPESWDHKPVVVYHPEDDKSACRPGILNSQKVGIILNTRVENGKLKAEAWLDKDRVEQVDSRIADAVVHNHMMELSTGLFTTKVKKSGVWNGKEYEGIARNYKPDHLAILPDKVGACSIADGAGLVRNEMSFSNITYSLRSAVNKRFGYEANIVDVYDGFFVFAQGDKLKRLDYEVDENEIEISGDPEEVLRVTEYRTPDGEFVGNASASPLTGEKEEVKNAQVERDSKTAGEKPMAKRTKKEIVDSLISNDRTKWEEKHRKQLMKMDEDFLLNAEPVEEDEEDDPKKKVKAPLVPDGNKPGQNKDNEMVGDIPTEDLEDEEDRAEEQRTGRKGGTGKVAGPAKAPKEDAADEPAKGKKGDKPAQNMSAADFIKNNAPPELRSSLMRGMKMEQRERARLIKTIISNKANKFTKAQLEDRDTDELEMLADLAAPSRDEREDRQHSYMGAGGSFTENESYDDDEDVLDLPVMNFANSED